MLAETFLVCWLITCIYVPLVLWVTQGPSQEEKSIERGLR